MFVREPILLKVTNSFIGPYKIILLTLLCFYVLNYQLTLVAYSTPIYKDYNGFCDSTLTCFFANVDRSFKFDGGIGGGLAPPPKPDFSDSNTTTSEEVKFWLRFVFDNLYNMILMIVMINIVSGIIIDTFSEMREG